MSLSQQIYALASQQLELSLALRNALENAKWYEAAVAQGKLTKVLDTMAELIPSLDTHAGELLVRSYAELAAKLEADCQRLTAQIAARKQKQTPPEAAGEVGTEPPRKGGRR